MRETESAGPGSGHAGDQHNKWLKQSADGQLGAVDVVPCSMKQKSGSARLLSSMLCPSGYAYYSIDA